MGMWLAMMMAFMGQSGDASARPIHLQVERIGEEGLRFSVIAAPAEDLAATFLLEVESDVAGGGNRSRHGGSANVRGGERAVLSVVTLGNAAPGRWRARLHVTPEGAADYVQERSAAR